MGLVERLVESAYPYAFSQHMESATMLISHYNEVYKGWRLRVKDSMDKNVMEKKRLQEKSGNGTPVTEKEWQRQEDGLETLIFNSELKKEDEQICLNSIKSSALHLFSFFNLIKSDFTCKKLSLEHYKKFLLSYQEIMQSGKDFPCFSQPPAGIKEKILKEIEKYLPAKDVA